MKVLIVQHVECEGPGYLEDFLHEKRIEYEIARMYERESNCQTILMRWSCSAVQ